METTAAEYAARGAAFLDEREPGWWERIDLLDLCMCDGSNCVAGQLFTTFYQALDVLVLTLPEAAELGLWVPDEGLTDRLVEEEYEELQVAWAAEIEWRQS